MLAYVEILERILLLSVRNSHDILNSRYILNSRRGSGRRKDFFLFGAQGKQKKNRSLTAPPSLSRYNIPSSARLYAYIHTRTCLLCIAVQYTL